MKGFYAENNDTKFYFVFTASQMTGQSVCKLHHRKIFQNAISFKSIRVSNLPLRKFGFLSKILERCAEARLDLHFIIELQVKNEE